MAYSFRIFSRTITAVLVTVTSIAVVVHWLDSASDSRSEVVPPLATNRGSADRKTEQITPLRSGVTPDLNEEAEQLTAAQKKAVEDAQRYFASNLDRLHQIISGKSPQLLAKRDKDAPNWKAVEEFGYAFRRKFMQEHEAELQKYRDLRKSNWNELNKFGGLEERLAMTSVYLQALSSTDPVGNSTVGEITREVLTNPDHYKVWRDSFAELERTVLEDEEMAKRFEDVSSGDKLIEMLRLSAPRHEALREQLSAQIPWSSEVQSFVAGLHYAKGIRAITDAYKRRWSSELEAINQEALAIQATMVRFIEQLPVNSSKRRELSTQYDEVLVALGHQRVKNQMSR